MGLGGGFWAAALLLPADGSAVAAESLTCTCTGTAAARCAAAVGGGGAMEPHVCAAAVSSLSSHNLFLCPPAHNIAVFSDGVLTPAISVVSAIEGIQYQTHISNGVCRSAACWMVCRWCKFEAGN